jgi:hypothetical protein
MNELTNLLAKMFIARPGVKAVQRSNGEYYPLEEPFTRGCLVEHLTGERTYGHYLINPETDMCKLFAFDIDFEKTGYLPTSFDSDGLPSEETTECNPREAWRNWAHPARNFMKQQLMHVASLLASKAHRELELPVAIAYSGYKGVHVYCFTNTVPTAKAREGAQLVMDLAGAHLIRGNNFYQVPGGDALLENLSIEIYPKQDTIGEKKFGNLLRLPLGVNLKAPKDPTFFIDLTQANGLMIPVKSDHVVEYLKSGDPWS